ncbi:MAG: hypothetical protein WBA77_24090 [Microcoleaceae cyanobacterium]
MSVHTAEYETLLAEYSNAEAAITLLKQYRPYWEMIPSLRRPEESTIAIPLPIVRLQEGVSYSGQSKISISAGQAVSLPCDLAVIMCDPEWKVKVGVEIFVFIHRPNEDFSDLLTRWRLTQIWLDKTYEWVMPAHYSSVYSQEAEKIYPLFVLLPETPERIQRGLKGTNLPFIIQTPSVYSTVEISENFESFEDFSQLELKQIQQDKGVNEETRTGGDEEI